MILGWRGPPESYSFRVLVVEHDECCLNLQTSGVQKVQEHIHDSCSTGPGMITRRRFFRDASATSVALSLTPGLRMFSAETPRSVYTNPIMGGDHPDASPIRVGNEFYLTPALTTPPV
jgi:hypothetical protein